MKKDHIEQALENLSEHYIEEALHYTASRSPQKRVRKIRRYAACFVILFLVGLLSAPLIFKEEKGNTSFAKQVEETLNNSIDEPKDFSHNNSFIARSQRYKETDYYKSIVDLGIQALPLIHEKITSEELEVTKSWIALLAMEEVLQTNLSEIIKISPQSPEQYISLWKAEKTQLWNDIAGIVESDFSIDEKVQKLKPFGVYAWTYLYRADMPETPLANAYKKQVMITELTNEEINCLYEFIHSDVVEVFLSCTRTIENGKKSFIRLLVYNNPLQVVAEIDAHRIPLSNGNQPIWDYAHPEISLHDFDNDGIQEIIFTFPGGASGTLTAMRILKQTDSGEYTLLPFPYDFDNPTENGYCTFLLKPKKNQIVLSWRDTSNWDGISDLDKIPTITRTYGYTKNEFQEIK